MPSLDQLAAAMTESVLPTLSGMAKSLYGGGRFVDEIDGRFRFALDNVPDRVLPRAQAVLADVEAALSARVGRPISVELLNGGSTPSTSGPSTPGPTTAPTTARPTTAPAGARLRVVPNPDTATATDTGPGAETDIDDDDPHIDVSELEDATDAAVSGVDKLVQAFPGAELIPQEER